MSEQICMKENYGPLQKDRLYSVINEGYDYFMIKCRGQQLCVPKIFTINAARTRHKTEELLTYEEIIAKETI